MAGREPSDAPTRDVLEQVITIVSEVYPNAQWAFLQLEVFEHLRSREFVRRFVTVFECFSAAVRHCSLDDLKEAEQALQLISMEALQFLCDQRIRQLESLSRKRSPFWWSILQRNPFQPVILQEFHFAYRSYSRSMNENAPYAERYEALKTSFMCLQEVIVKVQPHAVYDRLFDRWVYILSALIGFLATTIFARI